MISTITRIGMIGIGVTLVAASIWLNSLKKLLVNHAVTWSLVGIALILTGSVPALSSWTKFLGSGTVTVLFAVGALILIAEFRNSMAISRLTMKNRELAMQVALLNQDSETLRLSAVKADIRTPDVRP